MALSSFPSSRQRVLGKRRNSSVLTILLLLLSHSVWNTLQCGTSSSHPKNRPSSVDDDNGSSSDESLVNEGNSGSNAFADSKSIEKKLEQEKVQVCNDRLLDIIRGICGDNNFFTPIIENSHSTSPTRASNSLNELLDMASKRSSVELIQRRITRSLANECCLDKCNKSRMVKFCKDKSRARIFTPMDTKQQPTTEQELEDGNMEDPEVQLSNSPAETEESEPALYYPLYHLIKFMHRQFGNKNDIPSTTTLTMDGDEDQLMDNQQLTRPPGFAERELPLPQPRVQQKHTHSSRMSSSSPLEHNRPREPHQRHRGHSSLYPSEMGTFAGNSGVSATTNTASYRQGHAGRHQQRPHASTNGGLPASNTFPNQLPIHMQNYFPRYQGNGQQAPRKISANVFTSTMAPDVTLIRLDGSTDDLSFYKKR